MAKSFARSRSLVPVAVAGNGLLDRRTFIKGGAAFAATLTGYTVTQSAAAQPLTNDPWSLAQGATTPPYERPSRFEAGVVRTLTNPKGEARVQNARTPLQLSQGTITPNGLHFVVAQAGAPDIDPAQHKLVIHGMVKQPLMFTLESLSRYPMVSRMAFVECGGNSAPMFSPTPMQANLQALHGMVSCSEWTGVLLSTLLEETGIDPKAKWLIAEGADAPTLTRSVPMKKALDDAMIALYQNGERLMPANGYPARLLLPGWEGNMSIKWLRRIKAGTEPFMTREETSKYTDMLPDGTSRQFTFMMEAKSVITYPAADHKLTQRGFHEISGIAWSGKGRIRRVDISTDAGRTWREAQLQEPVLNRALTRFRYPWTWNGNEAILQSRAMDESGYVQPTRVQLVAERGVNSVYHYNGIQSWKVAANGEISNVHA